MTIELGGGYRVDLAGSGEGGGWLTLSAAVVAIPLILALYRTERRLVSARVGLGLLALRLLAVTTLLLSLMDPIATRSTREVVRGRVIVALDESASMRTTDPARDSGRAAALRSALSLEPAADLAALDRRTVARGLLARLEGPIAAEHEIEALAFAERGAPGRLADLVRSDAEIADLGVEATDWASAVEAALRPAADGAPVIGLVLVSDGRRNAPRRSALAETSRLIEAEIPVFGVRIGSTTAPRDAAVADLQSPDSALLGDTATILVTIKADGFEPGEPIEVRLEGASEAPLVETVGAPGPGSDRPTVAFHVPIPEPGPRSLTARVVAPGGPDLRPDNDARSTTIRVNEEKVRVLLVTEQAGWEFRYLRNALARDGRVQLDPIVLEPPPAPESGSSTYAAALPDTSGSAPGVADPLHDFDVIVIAGPVADSRLEPLWGRLDSYVAERGGTLMLAGVPPSSDGGGDDDRLRAMLPVQQLGRLPAIDQPNLAEPFPAGNRLEADGTALSTPSDWPMLQLGDGPDASRAIWRELPPLPDLLAGRLKPGATRLLGPVGGDLDTAVLAAHPYGSGKVLWAGLDATWRWRLRSGDAVHHRFWGQAIRWAADEEPAAGNRFVRFGPDRRRIEAGGDLVLRARIRPGAPIEPNRLVAAARIERDGREIGIVRLSAVEGSPGLLEGRIAGLAAGTYRARLDAPGLVEVEEDAPEQPAVGFEVEPAETDERVELAATDEALAALASATGGELLIEAEAMRLPDLLRARTIVRDRVEESPIWDTPSGLALFFGLVSIEWLIRKRSGLA